jgi:hypothetical protein
MSVHSLLPEGLTDLATHRHSPPVQVDHPHLDWLMLSIAADEHPSRRRGDLLFRHEYLGVRSIVISVLNTSRYHRWRFLEVCRLRNLCRRSRVPSLDPL